MTASGNCNMLSEITPVKEVQKYDCLSIAEIVKHGFLVINTNFLIIKICQLICEIKKFLRSYNKSKNAYN